MSKIVLTLCIIHQDDKVLLGMKKQGFGMGKWNGFGGKVLPDETIEDAARREVLEEASIHAGALEEVGVLEFHFQESSEPSEVHVFRATDFTGTPTETGEMRPRWFDIPDIPYDNMWADDMFWLPLLLEGKKFTGRFVFGPENTIVEQELSELAQRA